MSFGSFFKNLLIKLHLRKPDAVAAAPVVVTPPVSQNTAPPAEAPTPKVEPAPGAKPVEHVAAPVVSEATQVFQNAGKPAPTGLPPGYAVGDVATADGIAGRGTIPVSSLTDADRAYLYFMSEQHPSWPFEKLSGSQKDINDAINQGGLNGGYTYKQDAADAYIGPLK